MAKYCYSSYTVLQVLLFTIFVFMLSFPQLYHELEFSLNCIVKYECTCSVVFKVVVDTICQFKTKYSWSLCCIYSLYVLTKKRSLTEVLKFLTKRRVINMILIVFILFCGTRERIEDTGSEIDGGIDNSRLDGFMSESTRPHRGPKTLPGPTSYHSWERQG